MFSFGKKLLTKLKSFTQTEVLEQRKARPRRRLLYSTLAIYEVLV
nr:MAG TPA: hypothetical protein [Caudoviricetes sp.]